MSALRCPRCLISKPVDRSLRQLLLIKNPRFLFAKTSFRGAQEYRCISCGWLGSPEVIEPDEPSAYPCCDCEHPIQRDRIDAMDPTKLCTGCAFRRALDRIDARRALRDAVCARCGSAIMIPESIAMEDWSRGFQESTVKYPPPCCGQGNGACGWVHHTDNEHRLPELGNKSNA